MKIKIPKKAENKTKKKVLIVEDDRSLLSALNDIFKLEGFEVLKATNGKLGLKSALKNKPNLILLDLLMPVMDGMAMLRELRKDRWGNNVFVIMLTNKEPNGNVADEAERIPYRSCYLMKSDYDLTEIVKFAKNKISRK